MAGKVNVPRFFLFMVHLKKKLEENKKRIPIMKSQGE